MNTYSSFNIPLFFNPLCKHTIAISVNPPDLDLLSLIRFSLLPKEIGQNTNINISKLNDRIIT